MSPMFMNSVTHPHEQRQKVLPMRVNTVTHVYESNVTYVSDCTSASHDPPTSTRLGEAR